MLISTAKIKIYILLFILISFNIIYTRLFPFQGGQSDLHIKLNSKRNHVLIVYHSCEVNKHPWSYFKSKWPLYKASCTSEHYHDCYEGVPYIDFLIKAYDNPPADIIIFSHAHDYSWHYSRNFWDQINDLIGTPYFEETKYGGIWHDHWNHGPDPYQPNRGESWYVPAYEAVYNGTTMPHVNVSVNNIFPCCSAIFFKSELIQSRPKEEYIKIRNNLVSWSKSHTHLERPPGYYCGRVMEFTWHILLANKTNILSIKEWKNST